MVPLGGLEVAAVVVPPGGVAPSLPSVVGPLARPVRPPVLVTEGQAVVALAPPVVLVLVVEGLVLVVKALVLVVESLVLVLEVAVEPIVVVAEGKKNADFLKCFLLQTNFLFFTPNYH